MIAVGAQAEGRESEESAGRLVVGRDSLNGRVDAKDAAVGESRQRQVEQVNRMIWFKDDPRWRPLREEPRYRALLKRLDLDRYGPGLSAV